MNLSNILYIGYTLNILVFIVAISIAIHIQKEIGMDIIKKLHANVKYRVSNYILLMYFIPYVPAFSLIKSYYIYNKLKTDNILETYEKFINREPTGLMKLFLKENKEVK